ncbi:MAG: T9SS type A sorting domain-containing protein, partial [Parafilimonas sp.]
LATLDASTGELLSWTPDVPNSTVSKIELSDSLIFLQGNFNTIGNIDIPGKFCALEESTGRLVRLFPIANGEISAIKTDSNNLYIAGDFSNLGIYSRGLAALQQSDASVNTAFPYTNGTVSAIISDGNNGYFVAGDFSKIGTVTCNFLAHILPSGRVDNSFKVNVDGSIFCLAIDNSNLYLGGDFYYVNGQTRKFAASVNITTQALTSFNPNLNDAVQTIACSHDTIYLGGDFTSLKNKQRNHAGAITVANTVTSWNPSPNNQVKKILIDTNSKRIFLAGSFTSLANSSNQYLAKVNNTGGKVINWNPAPDQPVNSMALYGKNIYIGGDFYSVKGISRMHLAAIDTAKSAVDSFRADVDYMISDLSVSHNSLYVCGYFSSIQNSVRHNIAEINLSSGKVTGWNSNFQTDPDYGVQTVYAGNKIMIGGQFYFLNSTFRNQIARININGKNAAVSDWNPQVQNFNYSIYSIEDILHYNNEVFVGGHIQRFTTKGEQDVNLLAINDSSGAITHEFNNYPDADVNLLQVVNNKLLVAGPFHNFYDLSKINVGYRQNLAAFDLSTYSLSPDLYNPDGSVNGICAITKQKLLITGQFSLINSFARSGLVAINIKTGAVIPGWNAGANSDVFALALKDNTLFVGGNFTTINGSARSYVGAVSAISGATMPWIVNANDLVYSLNIKDSTLYIGGRFSTLNGFARSKAGAASTNSGILASWSPQLYGYDVYALQPLTNKQGGDIFIGGEVGLDNQYGLVRTNKKDGSTSSLSFPINGYAHAFLLRGNNLFVAGDFDHVSDTPRPALASFNMQSNQLTSFNPDIQPDHSSTYINALALTGNDLYFGCDYPELVHGKKVGRLTAVDTATGLATDFYPDPDGSVRVLTVSGNHLFAGGQWNTINGGQSNAYFAAYTLPPANNATALKFNNMQATSVDVSWTNGGGESRLVCVSEDDQTASPAEGKLYEVDNRYRRGNMIGTGYAVYTGTNNHVTVTGLQSKHTYTFMVYEYNEEDGAVSYLRKQPLSGSVTLPTNSMFAHKDDVKNSALSAFNISVYPNPATDDAFVSVTGQCKPCSINVTSALGTVVWKEEGITSNLIKIPLKQMASGVYIITITDGKSNIQKQLVKP